MLSKAVPCRSAGYSVHQAQQTVSQINSTEVKQALRAATEEAVKQGAFGAPWMHLQGDGIAAEDRFFFGADRLEQVACVLGERWLGLPGAVGAKQTSKL